MPTRSWSPNGDQAKSRPCICVLAGAMDCSRGEALIPLTTTVMYSYAKTAARQMRWAYRRQTAYWRTLPDFLIVGAQKSGTSTLYHLLSQHPQVKAALRKEVHFFDNQFEKGEIWYRAHFPYETSGNFITGEASPYYLFHPRTPERIARLLPQARLIFVLRDPVDRAYSHYHHNRRRGREPLSFEKAIAKEEERIDGEGERMLNDATYRSPTHQYYSYLRRGHYEKQLSNYREHFQERQMLVLKSELFFEDTATVWSRILDFLDLTAVALPEDTAYHVGSYSDLSENLRVRLQEHFASYNRRLAAEWGKEFKWD